MEMCWKEIFAQKASVFLFESALNNCWFLEIFDTHNDKITMQILKAEGENLLL